MTVDPNDLQDPPSSSLGLPADALSGAAQGFGHPTGPAAAVSLGSSTAAAPYQGAEARITGLWLTYPQPAGDGRDHAWHEVVNGGLWKSRCRAGLLADPAALTMPEDEFGRCVDCVLALMVADELGDTTWSP